MGTAKDILDRLSTDTTTKGRVKYEDALQAMREIAEFVYREGYTDGRYNGDYYFFDRYKEETMKELFPESKTPSSET